MYLKICYFDTSRWIGPVTDVTKVGVFTAELTDPLESVHAALAAGPLRHYTDVSSWDVGTFEPLDSRDDAEPKPLGLEMQMTGEGVLDRKTQRLAMLIVADVERPVGMSMRTGFVIQADHGVYLMSASGETIDRLGA